MRITIGSIRLALALLVLVAIAATYTETAARVGGLPNPFNFFGYFTIQSNVMGIAALAVSGLLLLRGRQGPRWLPYFRGAVVGYLVVVGLVYAVLLAPLGVEGGVPVPWANVVLHVVAPIVLPVDWLLVADRPALAWRWLWLVLIYPALWLTVVLIRGVTDGWVPYPFLNPENGADSIAVVCLGIAATILAAGALAYALSRLRVLRLSRIPPE
jgi:hypothetical protein